MNEIIPVLPDWLQKGEPVPPDLIGAKIVKFGALKKQKGGDLVLGVEYIPMGSAEAKQVEFKFTEMGMWIEDWEEGS